MSRSRRKTPIFGMTTAESDKLFKTAEHRRERRTVRNIDPTSSDAPSGLAFGNPWASAKDGKRYRRHVPPKDMRK
ncbi:hypothetical protein FGU64_07925 [Mesorhizobium sp. 8]|nr:hypothetical protein FGU64_07925 [Mesorhizobium sp. 8]